MIEDKEQIYILDTRNLPVRIGLIVFLLISLIFGWFAVRWQLGNLLADITNPNEPNANRTAELAKSFAPNDPMTNWLLASIKKESNPEYTEGFEKVIRLSPNDYRWWIQLGRAYEQANKSKEAEKAFVRAVEIAPTYTFPHWQLGNFYLRQDRVEEAFKELKTAAQNNAIYREQVFSIAWDYYDKDTGKVDSIAGNSPDVRAGLAKFYAIKDLPNKSLELWNTLTPQQKQSNTHIAREITQAFYEKRYMLTAVEFVNQLGIEKGVKAESIHNGGFEENLGNPESTYFGWKITPTEKMRFQLSNTKKKEGKRSLQVSFNGFDKLEINNIYQTIALKPMSKYEISFWVKTQELNSGGLPKLEILSANDNQILATSQEFPGGTNDWKQISVNFTTPKETEGIGLRTSRGYCGEKCPIFGTFWYDEFKIEKLSGE